MTEKKEEIDVLRIPPPKRDWYAFYTSYGYHPIPARANRLPGVFWTEYQTQQPKPEEIAKWKTETRKWPNIGCVTGKAAGVTVIDCDSQAAIEEVEALLPPGFFVPIVHSPKGRHYHFSYCEKVHTCSGLGESKAIDIRNDGGFCVLPPSTKTSGEAYVWDEAQNLETMDLQPIPEKLVFLLCQGRGDRTQMPKADIKLEEHYRNDTVFNTALSMRYQGVEHGETLKVCLVIGSECDPPMEEKEIDKTVASAYRERYNRNSGNSPPPIEEEIALPEEATNMRALDSEEPELPFSFKAADIERTEIRWVWKNYIPIGTATIFCGDPGAGKSWWTLNLCCKISKGGNWFDGEPMGAPANAYIMTYEDDASSVLKDRIVQLGGDQNRIFIHNVEHPILLEFSNPKHLERLEAELREIGDMRMLVVDVIHDFTMKTNPNAVQEVRAVLTPLIKMANRLNLALVLVAHMNKDQQKAAMYRMAGSVGGWVGKARSAFIIAKDEEGYRQVFPFKHNYSWPDPIKFKFRITPDGLVTYSSQADMEETLCPQRGRPQARSTAIAREFIGNMFAEREKIKNTDVEAACLAEGISRYAMRKIRQEGYTTVWDEEENSYVWKKA